MSFSIPKIKESHVLLDRYFKVACDQLLFEDGLDTPYYSLQSQADAVMVVAQDRAGRFVINREYRHPTRQVLLSCPGGTFELEEDPIQAAKRELLEETGFVAEEWTLLGEAYPYPGISSQKIYYVHARGALKQQEPSCEHGEILQTFLMEAEEIRDAILRGEALDGQVGTAFFLYHLL